MAPFLLALIGPTAVGKTAISLPLAEALGAEIISVDSRQVYRYLDVGADKISPEVRRRIPHHLIDVVDPDEPFSAADFVARTTDAVERIRRRGRIPLLVGGTPFYYAALAERTLTPDLPRDWNLRAHLEEEAQKEGREALYRRLAERDPDYAGRIHPTTCDGWCGDWRSWSSRGNPPPRFIAKGDEKRGPLPFPTWD